MGDKNMMIVGYIFLGLIAGVMSGLLGIGGGIIIIPTLVYLFHFTQHQAQGTTLALMIPPIGFLAAYVYYSKGYVNIKAAVLICLGFFIGGFFGGKICEHISDNVLQKIFAILLLFLSIKMFFQK